MKLRGIQKILCEDGGVGKEEIFFLLSFSLAATDVGAPCHCSLSYQLLLMWIDSAFQLLLTATKEGCFDDRNFLLLL